MEKPSDRRRFLKSAAALGAAIPAGAASQPNSAQPKPAPHADHDKQHAQHMRAAAAAAQQRPYMFLSRTEVAFLDAAVSHLIPKDELGPGAKEAGVTYFIDQQLFGRFGTMAKKYAQGPWPEGTPQQGYQSPLTPAAIYRAGIRDTNNYCRQTYGKPFDPLSRAQQDEGLKGLDGGKIDVERGRAQVFFIFWLANT